MRLKLIRQSALRFAVVPDQVMLEGLTIIIIAFQSTLRFAVVSDEAADLGHHLKSTSFNPL